MCDNRSMPTRSSRPKSPAPKKRPGTAKDHDFATIARSVVEQAIGEKLDGSPLPNPNAGKNPAAVALEKLGWHKGWRSACSRSQSSQAEGNRQKGCKSAVGLGSVK